jgi:uncharacterized protein YprB with RNaseH-like and TPR domain
LPTILCVSIKPFGKPAKTYAVTKPGNDRRVVQEAKAALEACDAWVSYFGRGYDVKFLNTRLLRWGLPPIEPRPHIDLFYALKAKLLTARRSQGHLLSWLETPESKLSVSADVWASVSAEPQKHLPTLITRCESDVRGLEALYRRVRHLIRTVTT